MLNKVIIMGRLTRDPELKHTGSDIPVVSFSLAVERDYGKDKKETDFIDVVAWRSTAEFVSKYFVKGQLAIASGRIQTRTYEDKEGNKRKAFEVVADSVYFGEAKKKDGNEASSPSSAGQNFDPFGGFSEVENDGNLPYGNLPF